MAHAYVDRWAFHDVDGDQDWRAPHPDVIGVLDLRTIPQMSEIGGLARGVGIFVYRTPHPGALIDLGQDIQRHMRTTDRTGLTQLQSLPASALPRGQIRDVIWSLFTNLSDPEGLTGPRPLMPTRAGNVELYLGGFGVIKRQRFDPHDLEQSLPVLDALRLEYRRIREETLRGRIPNRDPQFHRRYLSALVEKYHLPFEAFIPPDLPRETPLPHGTELDESFDQANSSTLGPDLTWTEITGDDWETISNKAEDKVNNIQAARAEHDLSTIEHQAQADCTWETAGSSQQVGTCVRFAAAAETFYSATGHANENQDILYKAVAASYTRLLETAHTIGAETLLCKTTIDGSTLTGNIGASETSVSDTAIVGGTRTGMWSFNNQGSSSGHKVDNYHAEDNDAVVAAVAHRRRRAMMQRFA